MKFIPLGNGWEGNSSSTIEEIQKRRDLMKNRYYYQSEGEKPMMSLGWWLGTMAGAILVAWNFLPFSQFWE